MAHCPFTYRVTTDAVVELAVNRPDYELGPWLQLGRVADVLEDVETPDDLAWRHFTSGVCWDVKSRNCRTDQWRTLDEVRRQRNETRGFDVVAKWFTAFGIRVRDERTWRATSLNSVIHPQFGPSLTAATNGVDVLLVSAPSLTADWMLVHRTNIIGPVTGTPVRVEEWDYVANRPRTEGARLRPDGAPKPPSKRERIAQMIALEVL